MRTVILAILAAALGFSSGCATNPVTGRQGRGNIAVADEVEMGKRLDGKVRRQYRVVTGTSEAERVERTGSRIAAVSDRRDIGYYFALVESGELNAFATPGGYIYVTSELNKMANDDELAAVIGHEVGHVAAYHSVNQMQKELGYNIFTALIRGDRRSQAAVQAADIAFDTVIMTGFSTEDEFQADQLGVKYCAKAGYDPRAMASFLGKLEERNKEGLVDKAFEFMLSNRNIAQRRKRAEAEAALYAQGGR